MPYKFNRLIMAMLLPSLLISLFFAPFVTPTPRGGEPGINVAIFALTVLVPVAIGWSVMIFIGLPIHLLLCKLDKRTSELYGVLGAIVGSITGFMFGLLLDIAIICAIIGLFVGAVIAILFHLIRGSHRALTPASNPPT